MTTVDLEIRFSLSWACLLCKSGISLKDIQSLAKAGTKTSFQRVGNEHELWSQWSQKPYVSIRQHTSAYVGIRPTLVLRVWHANKRVQDTKAFAANVCSRISNEGVSPDCCRIPFPNRGGELVRIFQVHNTLTLLVKPVNREYLWGTINAHILSTIRESAKCGPGSYMRSRIFSAA